MVTLLIVEVYQRAGALFLDDGQPWPLKPCQAYDGVVQAPTLHNCRRHCCLLRG